MRIKGSKRALIKKCDELWAEIVRSKGYCEKCGRADLSLNAHHVIGRVNKALRWDIRNGVCLCVWCHKFSKDSAHQDPIGFLNWFRAKRPEDYRYISWKKNLILKPDYEKIYRELNEIHKKAKAD